MSENPYRIPDPPPPEPEPEPEPELPKPNPMAEVEKHAMNARIAAQRSMVWASIALGLSVLGAVLRLISLWLKYHPH